MYDLNSNFNSLLYIKFNFIFNFKPKDVMDFILLELPLTNIYYL